MVKYIEIFNDKYKDIDLENIKINTINKGQSTYENDMVYQIGRKKQRIFTKTYKFNDNEVILTHEFASENRRERYIYEIYVGNEYIGIIEFRDYKN